VAEDVRDRLTFLQFLGVYFGSLVVALSCAFAWERLTDNDPMQGLFGFLTVAFGLAAWGRPWWWSATVRSTGWFAVLPNGALTLLFAIIAFGCLMATLRL
jgi:hypothetical protein